MGKIDVSRLYFQIACLLGAFAIGGLAGARHWRPYQMAREAAKTVAALGQSASAIRYAGEILDIPAEKEARIREMPGTVAAESFLWTGGLNEFDDLCPELGCIAALAGPDGRFTKGYPFRPEAIFRANQTPQVHYEKPLFNPARDLRPVGATPLPGGDILVTFHSRIGAAVFPFALGIARIAPDGRPRWYRADYTHHWIALQEDGTILAPGLAISARAIRSPDAAGRLVELPCPSGKPILDTVRQMDMNGKLLREWPVYQALARSPYAALLRQTADGCDPTHVNSADILDASTGQLIPGVAPGDVLVSMRNLSALAILRRSDGAVVGVFRGGFVGQHSVHQLSGSKVVFLDNRGDTGRGGLARVLEYDLLTGAERTVFPNEAQRGRYGKLFTDYEGQLDISRDLKRMVVTFSEAGRGVEVSLADGAVLREFTNVHPVEEDGSHKFKLFKLLGLRYGY